MESLLRTIPCASKLLEDFIVILLVAIDLIKFTKRQIYNMCNDEFWEDVVKKSKAIAVKNGININEKKIKERFV